jgi:hypothetical protein
MNFQQGAGMNQSRELELVELGDVAQVTKGMPVGARPEGNPLLSFRPPASSARWVA